MKKILDLMEQELKQAFEACGYEAKFAKVVLSNRPDLCEYQCNGAMAAAKAYKKKPIDIAAAETDRRKCRCVRCTGRQRPSCIQRSSGRDAWIHQPEGVRAVPG